MEQTKEKKQAAAAANAPEKPSAWAGIKKSLNRSADIAALKLKARKAESDRQKAYARLGELSYAKLRPREDEVPAEIEKGIAQTIKEISKLSHRITELQLQLSVVKFDDEA